MNRLALLPIETDPDDERLCGRDCHHGGFKTCALFDTRKPIRGSTDAQGWLGYARDPKCISATAQADRLVAVMDAAVKWVRLARFAEREGHAMGPSNRALVAAVEKLESTRAETEGK